MVYDYIITKPPLDEETLMHHGVKGQKWGIRKKRYSNGMTYRQMNKSIKNDYKIWKKAKRKGVDTSHLEKQIVNKYKTEDLESFANDYRRKRARAMKAGLIAGVAGIAISALALSSMDSRSSNSKKVVDGKKQNRGIKVGNVERFRDAEVKRSKVDYADIPRAKVEYTATWDPVKRKYR